MSQRILWKLILTGVLLGWALFNLIPYSDRPFDAYLKEHATAKQAEFAKLVDRANERVKAEKAPVLIVALKQIAREEHLDIAKQYFPDLNLDASIKSYERRNDAVLTHLLKLSQSNLKLGLDLSGGVSFTLEAPTLAGTGNADQRHAELTKAIEIIGKRVNSLGVAEPLIRPIGDNRIEVQLPGVSTRTNPEVGNVLKKPARLEFRLVHPQIHGQGRGFPQPPPAEMVPPGYEILRMERESEAGSDYEYFAVKRIPELTGDAVDNAGVWLDDFGKPEIRLNFTSEGTKRFGTVTEANIGNMLGIVLDGQLQSAPRIQGAITGGTAQITGQFTPLEAQNLANVLNNPLATPLVVTEQYEVGPTLAKDALASGKLAFYISTALTVAFIIFFYTYGGIVAAIGMAANVLIILGVMAMPGFNATLTMPGIAGIVLTLAMSVDSNILIFERMREELAAGKSLPASLEAGFEKAWSAILDSNITTLITAAVMIVFGTGAVKGFGVTLTIGIFTTMVAALIVSKLLLEALILPGHLRRLPMFSVLQNTKYDFLKWAKPSFIASWSIVLIGVAVVIYKGRDIYGIDFAGGDQVTLEYKTKLSLEQLRDTATAAGFKEISFGYQTQLGSGREVLKATVDFNRGDALADALIKKFPDAGLVVTGKTGIGPSVGAEIQWSALIALAVSLVGILLYVAFRFEFGYGVGAVVSTVHDLIMTVGIFVLFDRQFNASMVAAILLVAGYSINDTIVVFDRIREELKNNPDGTLRDLINRALNLTLSRTIITGGTTFLTAITLIVVTKGEVNDIAFTLLIGVITGTFSSLFIASPIFYWWHKGDRRHVEEHKDLAPKYEWVGASKASR